MMDWILRNLPYIIGVLLVVNVVALAIVVIRGRGRKNGSIEVAPAEYSVDPFSAPANDSRQHAEPLFAGLPLVNSGFDGRPDESRKPSEGLNERLLDGIPFVEPAADATLEKTQPVMRPVMEKSPPAPDHCSDINKEDDMEENVTMMLNQPPVKNPDCEETGYLKTTLARLNFQDGTENREFIMSQPLINIGRNMQSSDLLINNDNFVGRNHALVYMKDSKFFLVDLASRNGTWINGQKLTGQKELPEECEIQLGQTILHFSTL